MTAFNRFLAALIVISATCVFEDVCWGAIDGGGSLFDNRHSFVYYAATGEFAFEDGGNTWTDLFLNSDSGVFDFHENAHPSLTTHDEMQLVIPLGGGPVTSFSLGIVSPAGLGEPFLLSDLTGFAGCGPACDPVSPDFVYVAAIIPEPSMLCLAAMATLGLPWIRRRRV